MGYKVIVSINNKNQIQYIELFRKAYEFLWEKDAEFRKQYPDDPKAEGNENLRFTSLNHYYANMAKFFGYKNYRYVMLPVDENPLVIDLNARSIKVPNEFSKCASVQKDQLAELVMFTVDRYFDYMDLANTHIYVQWTAPADKDGNVKEGATRIEMIDKDSIPNQLRFAWPLTDEVTATPGDVKFSVRFFRVGADVNGEDVDPDNATEEQIKNLVYSLNTTEATIKIKPALQPELTKYNVEKPAGAIGHAIVNSLYSTSGLMPPVQPEFHNPGLDMTATTGFERDGKWIAKLKDDTVTMSVQAITTDAGQLSYKWSYINDDGSIKYSDCEKAGFGIVQHEVPVAFSKEAMIALAKNGRSIGERYFTYNENSMEPYTECFYVGDDFKDLLSKWLDPTAKEEEKVQLYEKVETFTVPSEGVITGTYQAKVVNTVSHGTDTLTTINPSYSNECLLPPPQDITFEEGKNLPLGVIFGDENKANIGVTLVKDTNGADLKFTWKKSTTSNNSGFEVLSDAANVATYTVTEPGWYTVDIKSSLNRSYKYSTDDTTANGESIVNICKVTGMPAAPMVQYKNDDGDFVDGAGDPIIYSINENSAPIELAVKASVPNDNDLALELIHDYYSYQWFVQTQTSTGWSEWTKVKTTDIFIDSITDDADISTLKIKHVPTNVDNIYKYKCVVTNNLNNQAISYDHSIEVEDINTDFTFIIINAA